MLRINIKTNRSLTRGIWVSESGFGKAQSKASDILSAKTQEKIDVADSNLVHAIENLRRIRKYPDPFDLPAINYQPDPFTFLNG